MPLRPLPSLFALLTAGAIWPAAAQTLRAVPAVPEPTVRETRREFFDSLSDTALAPDRYQIYRKNGARREVDLGGGFTAILDEQVPTRRDSPVVASGLAAAPSRVAGLLLRRPGLFGDLTATRTAVVRDTELALRRDLFDTVALLVDTREQHSAVPSLDARRRDSSVSLRWPPEAPSWIDFGVHRAQLGPDAVPPPEGAIDAAETFWRLRGQWQPQALPGLSLGLRAERAVQRPPGPDGGGTLEIGARYRFDNGVQLSWREAPILGLLSDGQVLEPGAAYRRTIGVEVPDGTPGGAFYTQWRDRNLVSSDNSLWVVGWRRAFRPDDRWLVQGFVEQAVPLAGPSPGRSSAIGGRLWRGAFPDNTFVTDLALVNSDRDDSLYASAKYTLRSSEQTLTALRASVNHQQPHGQPDAGITNYKGSVMVGWREPLERRLAALLRWTAAGTEAAEGVGADRRAHILLAGVNRVFGDQDSASARWSQRWERDETRPALDPRRTTLWHTRWVHELDRRTSLSAHLARRIDDLDGNGNSIGVEWGTKLSSKAVLALGYNLRGFDDHEIEFDERLKKGFTLRLRFTTDAVIGRWLDAPLPVSTPGDPPAR